MHMYCHIQVCVGDLICIWYVYRFVCMFVHISIQLMCVCVCVCADRCVGVYSFVCTTDVIVQVYVAVIP